MNQIKVNTVSETKVFEDTEIEDTKVEDTTPESSKEPEIVFKSKTNPLNNISNWSIYPGKEDGFITARNIRTGEVFEGSTSEFNNYLRG